MRAGPLSQKNTVELLNREFINSWLLLSDLERPFSHYSTEEGRRWARVALEEFDYPVETLVLSADGRVAAQLQYNDMLDVGPDERAQRYHEMLNRSLQVVAR